MQQGNPFYVSPLGGMNIGQSVTNMGNQWKQNEMMDMQRTQFEQQQQQQAQAKQTQQQMQALTKRAFAGDMTAVPEIYALDPTLGAKIDQGLGIQNEQQAKQAGGFLEKYLSLPKGQARTDFLQKTAGITPFTIDDDLLAMDEETRDRNAMLAAGRYLNKEQLAMLQGGGSPQATAGQRERAELLEQSRSKDPVVARSARIALGLDPRATGSAQQTIAERGTAKEVAKVAGTIEGGKQQAKLMAQLELEPEVKAAVQTATSAAQAQANELSKNKSNDSAWRVYSTGLDNLSQSLGKTEQAGPLLGRITAITADAQTADGAIAIMAPLLKQAFRSAGEGQFTDKDQQLLMDMIPTRKDLPEARQSKLEAIDAIMRAKLGQSEATSAPAEEPALDEAAIMSKYGIE